MIYSFQQPSTILPKYQLVLQFVCEQFLMAVMPRCMGCLEYLTLHLVCFSFVYVPPTGAVISSTSFPADVSTSCSCLCISVCCLMFAVTRVELGRSQQVSSLHTGPAITHWTIHTLEVITICIKITSYAHAYATYIMPRPDLTYWLLHLTFDHSTLYGYHGNFFQ